MIRTPFNVVRWEGGANPRQAPETSRSGRKLRWLAALTLGLCGVMTPCHAQTFSGPISITQGGTYTGNWRSTKVGTPAVTIKTASPVIITNSIVTGPGALIDCETPGAQLTVKNTTGYGVITGVAKGNCAGRFVYVYGGALLTVENCYLEHTTGININNSGRPGMVVRILYNRAKDIDARESNGSGGYQKGKSVLANFVGFNQVDGADVEIAWNEEVNIPYESQVEDSISTYGSLAAAAQPMLIHDNYVQGGYYLDMTVPYTGTGFNLGDNPDGTGYIALHDNQVVNYGNNGISVTAGHNNDIYRNRIVSSGYLPNSVTPLGYSSAGIWSDNYYSDPDWGNNNVHDNIVGYYSSWFHQRQDYTLTDTASSNNASLPDPITTDTENGEYTLWQQKLGANGIQIGPLSISPIPATAININANTGALPFTLGNGPNAVGSLTVTAISSDTTLVPTSSIAFSGTGANRSITVTPASNRTGTLTITVTVSDGTFTTSTSFPLTVVPVTFSSWQQNHFSGAALTDPNISGLGASPAGDGVSNLLKYYFGLDPLVPVASPAGLTASKLGGGNLSLTYQNDTSKSDVTAVVEQSADLITWNTNGVTDVVVTPGVQQTRTASIPVSGTHQFLRLRVTKL